MLRHAMCNEAFEGRPFDLVCGALRSAGYTGIEIAPFTLAPSPGEITQGRRRELREIMRGEGLGFVGLHWLMVSPAGLHVTTPDDSVRERGWNHIRESIRLCADLATEAQTLGAPVMVFGSPKQRGTTGGSSRAEATRRFTDGLRSVARDAEANGVTVLVEALPANQCDVVNTLKEAVEIVRSIGSPAVRTMFDTHNAVDEAAPHEELIERYFPFIRHVHVNETDGRYPGTGSYPFGPVLRTLERLGYNGWVSLEVFDFNPDPETVARESLRYLTSQS